MSSGTRFTREHELGWASAGRVKGVSWDMIEERRMPVDLLSSTVVGANGDNFIVRSPQPCILFTLNS